MTAATALPPAPRLATGQFSILVTHCELCTSGTRAYAFTLAHLGERMRVRACRACTRRELKRNPRLRPRVITKFPG